MTNHENYHLLLMRHGKADRDSGVKRDFDRQLTSRGRRDVGNISRWMLLQQWIPDKIVSSPAQRTRETALLVAGELQLNADSIIWDSAIYNASLDALLKVLNKQFVQSHCLLLIGHNPGLDSLLTRLSRTVPPRTGAGKLMTTSALGILDYGNQPIETGAKSAQLTQLLRPRDLG